MIYNIVFLTFSIFIIASTSSSSSTSLENSEQIILSKLRNRKSTLSKAEFSNWHSNSSHSDFSLNSAQHNSNLRSLLNSIIKYKLLKSKKKTLNSAKRALDLTANKLYKRNNEALVSNDEQDVDEEARTVFKSFEENESIKNDEASHFCGETLYYIVEYYCVYVKGTGVYSPDQSEDDTSVIVKSSNNNGTQLSAIVNKRNVINEEGKF
jgi:hypothetical protein